MEREVINLLDKRVERSLVSISAMIADAIEMAQKAKTLSVDSEEKLTLVQLELENLYLQLGKLENG
ncbi:hypothetical protein Dhaf_0600 [Desulfitobacterium hafniense DCB-2]|uniref:Uncharacterized protein n=2 Tax=root TaxID=1 RepID=B8FV20_DESHD|nr:hypothetical protein [Desulfitobacterium hafniense]ACL18666.1 hypothetical protein Dhaf_0600 [Desulfitobacterium hafniense DCB-2]MEA5024209.1 hypothetical protein [Desulfitobacterium hafniense]